MISFSNAVSASLNNVLSVCLIPSCGRYPTSVYFALLIIPESGFIIPAMIFISVDFPAPLGPAKHTLSFELTVKERSLYRTLPKNCMDTFSTESI